jgi:MFS family permease
MAWIAAGISPALAGLILTLSALPRAILAMTGGAMADRRGPANMMMLAGAAIALTAVAIVVITMTIGVSSYLLIGASLLLGSASAFYVPASTSMPRLLVPAGNSLSRAMAVWVYCSRCRISSRLHSVAFWFRP